MAIAVPPRHDGLLAATLEDRWRADREIAPLSGVQAIVRALLDQRREDRRHRIASAGFASGYPGSPLGGLDKELMRHRAELEEAGIVFQPGLNEELAATAVWGSQLAHTLPQASVEGVLGLWFGKNPGLDRAADAIRHANLSGTGPAGGAVAVVGDDPSCKSSTLPSACERTLSGLLVPVLSPSSVQETLQFGRHALRLSRAAGLWSALKVVADVADATATVQLGERLPPVRRLVEHVATARLLAPASLQAERSLAEQRLPAAIEYVREHELNTIVLAGERDELGLIASGSAYAELRRALADLGLHDAELSRLGVRLLKLAMPWPLDREIVRRFATDVPAVLVVEDKLPFLAEQVRSALYGLSRAPQVLGKLDADGRPLLSADGALSSDEIARALGRLLAGRIADDSRAARRLDALERSARMTPAPLPLSRTPFFCSGCPHSTSTAEEESSLVGAGIGCHVMLVQEPPGRSRAGEVVGLTQMGGEGAQWIGMAPFAGAQRFTQNVGDGTFHHSGSLAVRAAVAAGVNVTFKLLYNDVVAMTGAQDVPGRMSVPELTRMLVAEGVAKVAITTDAPARYRRSRLLLAEVRRVLRRRREPHALPARGVKAYDRARLAEVERELAATPGVTVLIHDQMCAAERRRRRKRGRLPEPAERAFINERVCEGCGDCGEQSGCLSVEPVQTELGRRTRIHQQSCNKDMSCLRGDCPSFLTVVPSRRERELRRPPAILPEPPLGTLLRPAPGEGPGSGTVRMVGIGGSGVVTVAQVLAMAAHLEGRGAAVLDQTGLSQKGGPVVSDVRIGRGAGDGAARAASASVDLLLGFDLLGAAEARHLAAADAKRTIAVLCDAEHPTGAMVRTPSIAFPDRDRLIERVRARVAQLPVIVDAQAIAERAFGDDLQTNIVLLGAAWQLGALPVRWDALCRAVELNGAAVEANTLALSWGRAIVAEPGAVAELLGPPPAPQLPLPADVAAEVAAHAAIPEQLRELVGRRAADLRDWGGKQPKRFYLDAVQRVARHEQEAAPGHVEIAESVARHLHHLLAYKDEYEVARLHLLPQERQRREREFGVGARWWLHLHPPLLRALGLSHKIRLGRRSLPLLYALRAGRRLRGTPFDLFGHTQVRRVERALPAEYLQTVESALELLTPDTHGYVLSLAEQADVIRGYEQIKLRNVRAWRAASAELLRRLNERG